MTSRGDGESERLRKLQAVVDVALAHLSVDDLLRELLPRVKDLLDADTCAVLLLDEEAKELVARAASGLEEEVERGVRIPVGKGFAGRIVSDMRTVVIDDVDHADVLNPLLREKGVRSLVGTPLFAGDRAVGVIHAGSLSPRLFRGDDITLLELVASRVAIAVERALAHEELIRVSELKSSFIGVAAHELRTPVTVIYGVSETFEQRWHELDDETRDRLRQALYSQSVRLKTLVEQLLDLSRLDTNAIRIDPRPMRVRERIIELIRLTYPERSGEIRVDIDPDLEFVADAEALDHVVTNLVDNAFRYGGRPIDVSAAARDTHYRLRVEDHGDGVPPEFIPRMFERFSRGGATRDSGAAGLGLAIALAYAQAHGGTITYQPAVPRGSRFELVLPRPVD